MHRAKSNVNSKKYTKQSGGPDVVSETAKIQSKIQRLLSRIPRLLFIFNFLFVYLHACPRMSLAGIYFWFFIYQQRSEAEKQKPHLKIYSKLYFWNCTGIMHIKLAGLLFEMFLNWCSSPGIINKTSPTFSWISFLSVTAITSPSRITTSCSKGCWW